MFDSILQLLKEQEPLISALVGVTTMLAAIWGVVQLMFISGRNSTSVGKTAESDSPAAGPQKNCAATHLV